MSSSYHVPVLSLEVIKYFISDKSGTYVDCTLGGGSHSELILNQLNKDAKYIGIDQDKDAIQESKKKLTGYKQVKLIQNNFSNLSDILKNLGIKKINGLLLDLGVSSFQIDEKDRGFSYSQDTALDMRMNQSNNITASDILNDYSKDELTNIFYKYGEERNSKIIAGLIVKEREKEKITSTIQLKNIIEKVVYTKYKIKSFSRIFQALRIEVNNELENLQIVLNDSINLLKTGGRIVVISYHSLEDRIVKRFLKYWENPCTCPDELPVCSCGNVPQLKIITKKAIRASMNEVKINSRARSALLRVGEKI